MLQKLLVHNYAIISHLSLLPDDGLNTVTGETGAGKSIILGALSLILGERADTSVLINKQEKCIVEAHFLVADNTAFREAIKAADLDDEDMCVIRREIAVSGKSRAFVNDTPVTLSTLNALTSLLVDLHQQFGHLALEQDNLQLNVIDAIGKTLALKEAYRHSYQRWKTTAQELKLLLEKQAAQDNEADYKQYLLTELEEAGFTENEIENADAELRILQNGERILTTLESVRLPLDEGEFPIVNELKKHLQALGTLGELLPAIAPLEAQLENAYNELRDVADQLAVLSSKVDINEEKINSYQERVDLGYRLLKKHNLRLTEELLLLQNQLRKELNDKQDAASRIARLEAETQKLHQEMMLIAGQLTAARKAAAPPVSKRVNELMKLVGMPNAAFSIAINQASAPQPSGMDRVEFLLDANKSGSVQPLQKAASGGEMSRIMLCIKSLTAQAMQLPTLIFDEVDTGISGEAAMQVGALLASLARHHQVICITHQPQVAARGTRHFYVFKETGPDGRIATQVRVLAEGERIEAIARMIGGESPGAAALQHARELVS